MQQPVDRGSFRAEIKSGDDAENCRLKAKRLDKAFQDLIGLSVDVECVALGTLLRSEKKSKG